MTESMYRQEVHLQENQMRKTQERGEPSVVDGGGEVWSRVEYMDEDSTFQSLDSLGHAHKPHFRKPTAWHMPSQTS